MCVILQARSYKEFVLWIGDTHSVQRSTPAVPFNMINSHWHPYYHREMDAIGVLWFLMILSPQSDL